jgi:uncharacterized membrane protein YcgQ (UPF0703/DUF1980 family)
MSFTPSLFLLFLLSFTSLQAESPTSLSLSELSKEGNRWLNAPHHEKEPLISVYEGKMVEMRGFLLQQDKQWFLFTQPILRSCCMGKKEHLASKLYVEGNFDKITPGRAYTVKGTLIIQPTYNEQGELISLYRLENASLEGS